MQHGDIGAIKLDGYTLKMSFLRCTYSRAASFMHSPSSDDRYMTATTNYSAQYVEVPDSDEGMLVFDPAMLLALDWREGDVLDWAQSEGGVSLTNVSRTARIAAAAIDTCSAEAESTTVTAIMPPEPELPIFLVETIISHRMQYAVRAKSLEHAYDTVTMEEAPEFDQNCLGETIFSGREVTVSQLEAAAPAGWASEDVSRAVHTVDYSEGS